jgi:hypothetical protein
MMSLTSKAGDSTHRIVLCVPRRAEEKAHLLARGQSCFSNRSLRCIDQSLLSTCAQTCTEWTRVRINHRGIKPSPCASSSHLPAARATTIPEQPQPGVGRMVAPYWPGWADRNSAKCFPEEVLFDSLKRSFEDSRRIRQKVL